MISHVDSSKLTVEKERREWICIPRNGERKWELLLPVGTAASLVRTILLHWQRKTNPEKQLHCPGGLTRCWERINPVKHCKQVCQHPDFPMSLPDHALQGSPKILQEDSQLTYYEWHGGVQMLTYLLAVFFRIDSLSPSGQSSRTVQPASLGWTSSVSARGLFWPGWQLHWLAREALTFSLHSLVYIFIQQHLQICYVPIMAAIIFNDCYLLMLYSFLHILYVFIHQILLDLYLAYFG